MTREEISREILRLRRAVDVQLRFGSPEAANELLNQISALEQQKGNHNDDRS